MIAKGRRFKNIIMHGNSLMNLQAGNTTPNGHYCATKIYTNLLALGLKNHCLVNLSINGDPSTSKIANWNTQTVPHLIPGSTVFLWEIHNSVSANGLTGLQAYNELVTIAGLVHAAGCKIVVGSATARNHTNDTDQFTRNSACNALLRADHSMFDLFIDVGALPHMSTQADTADTNYYQSDKLHHATNGSDYCASYIANEMWNGRIVG